MKFTIGTILLINEKEYKITGYMKLKDIKCRTDIWEEYRLLSEDNKEYWFIYEAGRFFFAEKDDKLEFEYKKMEHRESYEICVCLFKDLDLDLDERVQEDIYVDSNNEDVRYSITKWGEEIEYYKNTRIPSIRIVYAAQNEEGIDEWSKKNGIDISSFYIIIFLIILMAIMKTCTDENRGRERSKIGGGGTWRTGSGGIRSGK